MYHIGEWKKTKQNTECHLPFIITVFRMVEFLQKLLTLEKKRECKISNCTAKWLKAQTLAKLKVIRPQIGFWRQKFKRILCHHFYHSSTYKKFWWNIHLQETKPIDCHHFNSHLSQNWLLTSEKSSKKREDNHITFIHISPGSLLSKGWLHSQTQALNGVQYNSSIPLEF